MSGRPSTPFPHMHSISHVPQSHYAQPLHFHMEAMVTPVPPSLLKRNSSSSTHSINEVRSMSRRESSSSTSSTSSPLMPTTPQTPASSLESPTYLSLPPSMTYKSIDFGHYQPKTTFSPVSKSPSRPQLKRRDTPRPTTSTLKSLNMSICDTSSRISRKTLTSVIDGGSWVVVE